MRTSQTTEARRLRSRALFEAPSAATPAYLADLGSRTKSAVPVKLLRRRALDRARRLVYRRAVMAGRRSRSLESWRRDAVRRIVASREATLVFVARLPEHELRRPRTLDRWSVKDVLGHLLGCDEETVRRFRLIARGHAERIHWFEDMADADRFNARCVARVRRLGLRALLRRRARAQADLVELLRRLPAQALRDPAHEYTVTQWLPAPGWSHERDHLAEIRAWWRAWSRRR